MLHRNNLNGSPLTTDMPGLGNDPVARAPVASPIAAWQRKGFFMRLELSLAASAVLLGLTQLPARASSCAEQIGTIERRLDSAGAVHVAGLQDGHAIRSSHSQKALAAAPTSEPSDTAMIPTSAHVTDARRLLERAANEDRQGHQRACEDTMTEAKGMIGALP